MILGLRTFIAHVRPEQLDAAKAWYTLFAGVARTTTSRSTSGSTSAGSSWVCNRKASRGRAAPSRIGVPPTSRPRSRVVALGATVVQPVQDVGGYILVATVADPFGNHIGLIQNPHFDAKAVR